ncbi:unnamed protein product [Tenebrio molitor]|nr:unnamed protein product [Tenebrio molitor]
MSQTDNFEVRSCYTFRQQIKLQMRVCTFRVIYSRGFQTTQIN